VVADAVRVMCGVMWCAHVHLQVVGTHEAVVAVVAAALASAVAVSAREFEVAV
jgi:hypothetical protein